MPLPPLPENSTARLFLYYTTGVGPNAQEHVMTIRYNAAAASAGDIMTDLADLVFNAGNTAATHEGWKFLRAETQAQGAIPRFPVAVVPALLGYVGTGDDSASPSLEAREVRFIGRGTTTGRKVSLSLYGVSTSEIAEPDFRFTPPAGAFLSDMTTLMNFNGPAAASFINIGGGPTSWYTYVNWQYNSHWETEQRA